MPLFRLLILLFLTVPLIEIYILIQVGSLVGVTPTIVLVVLTAFIGAFLLRYQGLQTIARVQEKLEQGQVPATDMLGGVILLMSGALLLTPGFFTDCIGFLCLVPSFRAYLATEFLNNLFRRGANNKANRSVTLEGDFWEEEDRKHLHD